MPDGLLIAGRALKPVFNILWRAEKERDDAERVELLEVRERIARTGGLHDAKQAPCEPVNKAERRGEMAERLKATVC